MRVQFDRARGYGQPFVLELDVLPREGDEVTLDGNLYEVQRVRWILNEVEDPTEPPVVRVNLDVPVVQRQRDLRSAVQSSR